MPSGPLLKPLYKTLLGIIAFVLILGVVSHFIPVSTKTYPVSECSGANVEIKYSYLRGGYTSFADSEAEISDASSDVAQCQITNRGVHTDKLYIL
jgi:hypothetical protein